MYTEVIAQILTATARTKNASNKDMGNNESFEPSPSKSWPPCPWLPCDDDDDGGGKKPGRSPKKIGILAREVVAFEKKIAMAFLDLYANFFERTRLIH